MIIKRNLKSQMPSMKRCRLGCSVADDDEPPAVKKKRKMNGYFPLSLLGDVAAGIIPLSGYGIHQIFGGHGEDVDASWCTEISSCAPGEVVSKSNGAGQAGAMNPTAQVHRPPLVRTSRGRVQVLPSRFNDSILDNWRKESKPNAREIILDEDFEPEKEKPGWKTPKQSLKKGLNEGKFGQQCRKFSALCPEDGDEMVYMRFKNVGNKKKYSSSRSSLTSLHEQLAEVYATEEVEEKFDLGRVNKESKGDSRLEEFISGDIVWAKSGKKDPFWPAIVIDPTSQAPGQVLSSCIAGAVCVMFFGYSGNGTGRDYGWVKQGMIFPFVDNVERFQGQSDLNDSKPSDFRTAIEEAFLAENGFIEKLTQDRNLVAGKPNYLESTRGVQEATGSNQDQECDSQDQDVPGKKNAWPCDHCGLRIPLKSTKKMKVLTPKGRFLCKACDKLRSKHYCGICKKMQNQSDSGTWVRCDGCKVWVHAECGKISSKVFKNLGATDYYCPACKAKFNFELSDSEKWQPKVKFNKNSSQLDLPNKVTVCCAGVEGIYFPRIHLVEKLKMTLECGKDFRSTLCGVWNFKTRDDIRLIK